jgi:hypothetical protein
LRGLASAVLRSANFSQRGRGRLSVGGGAALLLMRAGAAERSCGHPLGLHPVGRGVSPDSLIRGSTRVTDCARARFLSRRPDRIPPVEAVIGPSSASFNASGAEPGWKAMRLGVPAFAPTGLEG